MSASPASLSARADDVATRRIVAPRSQRQRLLDGMARTVARQGYAATSVATVLDASGVSRRTFYEQFADKEDCFLAAYDQIASACAAGAAAARDAAGEAGPARLSAVVRALLTTLAAEPDFAHLAVVDAAGASPRTRARRELTVRGLEALLADAAGRVTRPPSPTALRATVGALHEVVHAHVVSGRAALLPALADELAAIALTLLR